MIPARALGVPLTLALSAGLSLPGCSTSRDTLYFGTHTTLGVDVSGDIGTPDHATLGYARDEVAIVPPRAEDGQPHSVLGGLDADLSLKHFRVNQVFATGAAAEAASQKSAGKATETQPTTDTSTKSDAASNTDNKTLASERLRPVLFAASTDFSLVSIGNKPGAMAPELHLGYKRTEAAVIPVSAGQPAGSVYATIALSNLETACEVKENPVLEQSGCYTSATDGVRFVHQFATGDAAVQLATKDHQKLEAVAGAAIAPAQAHINLMNTASRKVDGCKDEKLPLVVAAIDEETRSALGLKEGQTADQQRFRLSSRLASLQPPEKAQAVFSLIKTHCGG